jgi:hypothetical protein
MVDGEPPVEIFEFLVSVTSALRICDLGNLADDLLDLQVSISDTDLGSDR